MIKRFDDFRLGDSCRTTLMLFYYNGIIKSTITELLRSKLISN